MTTDPMLTAVDALAARAAALAGHLASVRHPADLAGRRLVPDMLSLAEHAVVLGDGLTGAVAQLAGETDHPAAGHVFNRGLGTDFGPLPVSMDAVAVSLAAAREEVARLLPAAAGRPVPDVVTVARPGDVRLFPGCSLLTGYVIPNGEFHLSMIYAIARQAGVELGKRHYEGPTLWRRPEANR